MVRDWLLPGGPRVDQEDRSLLSETERRAVRRERGKAQGAAMKATRIDRMNGRTEELKGPRLRRAPGQAIAG